MSLARTTKDKKNPAPKTQKKFSHEKEYNLNKKYSGERVEHE